MTRTRTVNTVLTLVLMVGAFGFGLSRHHVARGQDAMDTEAKIENAMSAAPLAVAENATILDNELDANEKFVVLREGSNGWYCSPDAPGTPGPDPWCYDDQWLAWSYALIAGEKPNTTALGLAYMFQGGSDASNSDPFATEPAEGEEWMVSPPHVMFIQPGPIDLSTITTDHHTGEPWVMWAGTPYEHVMMPLDQMQH